MLAWLPFGLKKLPPINDEEWAKLMANIEYLQKMEADSLDKLKTIVNLMLNKAYVKKAAKTVAREDLLAVLTQASVLVLNLGDEWLSVMSSIVTDNKNKVSINQQRNFGMSYLPVLSSLIDELNGEKNGIPPLHSNIDETYWQQVFTDAMNDFKNRVVSGPKNEILFDTCAADNLANFFAIMSEVFFIAPDTIRCAYPDVYTLLTRFYRQNTAIQQNMNTNNAYKSLFAK